MNIRKAFFNFSNILLLVSGCQLKDPNFVFLDKFAHNDFSEHVNTLTFFRSLDEGGNMIYFFHFLNDECESPYIVTVDRGMRRVIDIDLKLRRQLCDKRSHNMTPRDSTRIRRLVETFLTYKISLLHVDDDTSVYVNVDASAEPDLMKFRNAESGKRVEGLRKIYDNWYTTD